MIQPLSRYFRKLNRHHLRNTYENKSNLLAFGSFGLQSIEKGYLTVHQIEAVRRTLSSRLKRKGKIWIRAYPHSSCTAKPKEVRRGRGKGNVDYWYCTVKPGRILFEVKTSSQYVPLVIPALQLALGKLPRQAQIISRLIVKIFNFNLSMYLSLVFFPLIGSILSGFGSRWRGDVGAKYITTSGVALTFCCSLYAFYEVALCHSPCLIRVSPWRITETTIIYWGFLFDTLTCVRLIVVTSISTLVHLYSTEYRGHDPHLPRFRAYLSFFTFFRLILVTAENLVQRFVGWEGVGLCSYLLINFWFARIQANKSAIKARILNRIGDFGLSIAIFTIYSVFGSVDYSIIFSIAPRRTNVQVPFFITQINILDFICFFLFIGAVGKSAQVGLHTWLPDAREGPTPVSALIHAATRVTAGVFLICRCSPLLEYAPNRGFYITILGGRTAFLAATTGLLQNDLKRVIAYSTCSQLGYRVFAAGLSGYSVSMFHLSNHAFFKALLFLGAGSVIHARADEQDRRKRGGLVKLLPLTYTVIVVGSLALRGFPFLTGFYSKDVILELAYGSFTVEGRFVHTLGVFAAFFTAYYSTRLLARTFLRPANGLRVNYEHAHESPFPRAFPLVLLSFASLFVGFVSRDMFIGLGTDFWGNALFTLPTNQHFVEAEWLETSAKSIPLFFSFGGMFLATYQYTVGFSGLFALKETKLGRAFYTFLNRKWFFDKVYNEWVAVPLLKGAYTHTYQNLDRGLLEYYGPNGLFSILTLQSDGYSKETSGFVFRKLFIRVWSLSLRLLFLGGWIELASSFEIGVVFILVLFRSFFNHKY